MEEASDYSDTSGSDRSWIESFAMQRGNEFMVEVDYDYIKDSFNLYGISAQFSDYKQLLRVILDEVSIEHNLTSSDSDLDDDSKALSVVNLYGLIHARFIVTPRGLELMRHKYLRGSFGFCPRLLCKSALLLPIGLKDSLGFSKVKVFCPRCKDVYSPNRQTSSRILDGAYFGTTFPHLLLMTYTDLVCLDPIVTYTPKIFGFKIHSSSPSFSRDRFQLVFGQNKQITEEEEDDDNDL